MDFLPDEDEDELDEEEDDELDEDEESLVFLLFFSFLSFFSFFSPMVSVSDVTRAWCADGSEVPLPPTTLNFDEKK